MPSSYWLNRDKIRARQKAYYFANKEKRRAYAFSRRKERLEYVKNFNKRVRFALFLVLGGAKCIRCGFSDIRALQFDHIHGSGRKEIVNQFRGRNNDFIKYYLAHVEEAKEKLQVLCANCNWIKRSQNNENGRQLNKTDVPF